MLSSQIWLVALVFTAPETATLPPIDLLRGLRAAQIAHLENDHDRELESLRLVLETYPDDVSLLYSLLVHHRHHEVKPEERARSRRSVIEILDDPGSLPPVLVIRLIVGDPEAERDLLEKTAAHLERRAQAQDAELLKMLSETYRRLEDLEGRLSALERLVAIEPTTLERWELIQHYRKTDRLSEAIEVVMSWLGEPDYPPMLRTTAIDLLSRTGRFADVEKQLDLYYEDQLASRREQLGEEKPQEIRQLDGSLTSNTTVIQNAAWNFRDAGQDEAAEKYFRRSLELSPDNPNLRTTVLHLYGSEEEVRQLQAEEATRWQEEDDPNSLFSQGTELLTAGDAAGAFELLKRAAPGLPHLEAAWYNLGMAAYRLEEWEAVADAFGKAGELNATRDQSFFYRGLALEKLGRCSESVNALEKALELGADKPLIHYYLAACLMRLGQREKAIRHRALYDASRKN